MAIPTSRDLVSRIVEDIETHATYREFAGQISEDVGEVYALQDRVVAELVRRGTRTALCGYKIAVNAKPLMAHFGVSEPISGQLFTDQKHSSPALLTAANYRSLLFEVEIAAVMGCRPEARRGGHDRATVAAAIEKFIPAFELVDTRDAYVPDLVLTTAIAQNVTNEGLVTGGPGLPPGALDIEGLEVVVTIDDLEAARVTGAAPQHPLDAVAWLANHLAGRGKFLEAGTTVLCGAHMPPKPVGSATRIHATMGPLGDVEFTVR